LGRTCKVRPLDTCYHVALQSRRLPGNLNPGSWRSPVIDTGQTPQGQARWLLERQTMKHVICTAAGRVTVEPVPALGRMAVKVGVSKLPGLPAILLPSLFIEPHEAQLLAQAFDMAAEECTQRAPAGVTADEKAAAAGCAQLVDQAGC
jgi:hypothetical protein